MITSSIGRRSDYNPVSQGTYYLIGRRFYRICCFIKELDWHQEKVQVQAFRKEEPLDSLSSSKRVGCMIVGVRTQTDTAD